MLKSKNTPVAVHASNKIIILEFTVPKRKIDKVSLQRIIGMATVHNMIKGGTIHDQKELTVLLL